MMSDISIKMLDLLTPEEAAQMVGIKTVTIENLRRAGKIGSLKIAGRVRYKIKHIEDYLESVEICPNTNLKKEKIEDRKITTSRGAKIVGLSGYQRGQAIAARHNSYSPGL
jgi:excisionase family DNA binding protein